MYNLTVAQIHTYYVMAGTAAVLVHNTGPCGPGGVKAGWVSRVADNGRGTVWQDPAAAAGNTNQVRIMQPTAQYPNGYVRFYNQYGQPVGLDGKPGPNSVTHIPINPDGTYPLPAGW